MPTNGPARLISASAASVDSFMTVSSSRRDADCFDDVAQVARSVPEWLVWVRRTAVGWRVPRHFFTAGRSPDRLPQTAELVFLSIPSGTGRRTRFHALVGDV